MEDLIEKVLFSWPWLLVVHFFVAAAGGMFVGFLPEALVGQLYYNTAIEAFSPMIAISAFLLGYFVSFRILSLRAAPWTWILGLAWLIVGIREVSSGWSASWSPEKTVWGYVLANLFGPGLRCSGSECLYEVIFTAPFAASITYSIGAYLRQRRLRPLSHTQQR